VTQLLRCGTASLCQVMFGVVGDLLEKTGLRASDIDILVTTCRCVMMCPCQLVVWQQSRLGSLMLQQTLR